MQRLDHYQQLWKRDKTNRLGTEDRFEAQPAKFVRLVSEGQDITPTNRNAFGIDEFEVWSAGSTPRNVALSSAGARASGASRKIEDFPGAYGPQKAIDGKTGERFLAVGGQLTIELPGVIEIDRVVFSSARGESRPDHSKFAFVADYRIEVSIDGMKWKTVSDSSDRKAVNDRHRDERLRRLETSQPERKQIAGWKRDIAKINAQLAAIPRFPGCGLALVSR